VEVKKMILEPIRVLTFEQMDKIHANALEILEKIGMKIESQKALSYLQEYGCNVDTSTMTVRFPSKIVQKCVEKMQNDYSNPDRLPEKMAVRYSHIRFKKGPHKIHQDFTTNAGGFCCYIHDLNGIRRSPTLEDVHRSINLVNKLDNITYTGLPVSDQNTPVILRPVAMAAELAKYTTKFGGVETFKKEDIPYLVEIGTVIKGSLDALKKEPILVGYAEARSPLCLDNNMAEIFIEYIERGFPQTLDTMPNGGATSPVTAAGNLSVGMAETLGALVLGYSIDENAVVGVDIIPSYFDMSSGIFRYASGDRIPLLVARVQLISEYYGCPSGVHGGKTDSSFVNIQCGIEKAMTTAFPILAGAVGIGTVGHLENAVTFSPQQLVIDNEIFKYMKRTLEPIVVNEETLAFDTIAAAGIGGTYLDKEHTLNHFKDELFFSDLFETLPWESVHAEEIHGMENTAWEIANSIWKEKPEIILEDEKLKEIEKIVKHAKSNLLED
jgi:trimethylamine--corrinoid protein Co-methyltransferase